MELLTVRNAASRAGTSEHYIRKALEQGKLKLQKRVIEGTVRVYVKAEDIDAWKNTHNPPAAKYRGARI